MKSSLNGKQNKKLSELKVLCKKIFSNFEVLKVLSCAEVKGNTATVFDPPYILEINKDEETIILKIKEGDLIYELVILTPYNVTLNGNEEDLDALIRICKALTSMNFRRYILKNFTVKEN